MLSVATDAQAHDELRLDLDELVREGARRMLAAGLEAEVDDYLAAHLAERDEVFGLPRARSMQPMPVVSMQAAMIEVAHMTSALFHCQIPKILIATTPPRRVRRFAPRSF
jgi:hypothetical protein